MNPQRSQAFATTMSAARSAYAAGELDSAFQALERAHVLGQRYVLPHLQSHIWMLRVGLARKDAREIRGQLLRILAVFPAHLMGWLPVGNTGGANVSPLEPMAIPKELAVLMGEDEAR